MTRLQSKILSNGPSKNYATQRQGMQKGVNCDIVETVHLIG